jgi:hypothetical protein
MERKKANSFLSEDFACSCARYEDKPRTRTNRIAIMPRIVVAEESATTPKIWRHFLLYFYSSRISFFGV